MSWWIEIGPFAAGLVGAIGGSAMAPKLFGDWWLEKVKARYAKELAEIEHKLSILLSDRQNAFSMGASSHMATVLFDKHIGFCEEYVEAMSKALQTLIQAGKKDQPLDAKELLRIRQKWALWLNDEIEVNLDRFEQDITRIGGDAQVFDANGAPVSRDTSIRRVIADLRKILATEELTNLRNVLVENSVKGSPQAP
ncbi:MAG: hypothetical protein ABSC48_10545 [Terracidiphilus sp.]|jgi:hypothetical protein